MVAPGLLDLVMGGPMEVAPRSVSLSVLAPTTPEPPPTYEDTLDTDLGPTTCYPLHQEVKSLTRKVTQLLQAVRENRRLQKRSHDTLARRITDMQVAAGPSSRTPLLPGRGQTRPPLTGRTGRPPGRRLRSLPTRIDQHSSGSDELVDGTDWTKLQKNLSQLGRQVTPVLPYLLLVLILQQLCQPIKADAAPTPTCCTQENSPAGLRDQRSPFYVKWIRNSRRTTVPSRSI